MISSRPVARGNVFPPALSGDGQTLAWSGRVDGRRDVFLKRGEQTMRLTDDEAIDTEPTLSGDGQTVVWSRRQDGDWDLMVARADETPRPLLQAPGKQNQPSLSDDGGAVVFKDGDHISRFDGKQAEVISHPPAGQSDSHPKFRGGRVFWERLDHSDFSKTLWMQDEAGVNKPVLENWVDAAVSKDGRTVVYTTFVDGDKDLFKLDLRNSQTTVISAKKGVNESFPSVAAEGDSIAYNVVDFRGDPVEAFIHLQADGQDRQVVGRNPEARDLFPQLSDDGSTLTWTRIDNQDLTDRTIFVGQP